ncbi:MAG: NAD(P)H-hydrate dehydratase [Anaerolineales bacterium]|nr:NAD(P)H-hydrate dehydratase [Anaerolineales bacterium]
MAKIVTTEQMRKIEKAADTAGLTYDQMMQNAGKVIADAALERLGDVQGKRVAILAGPGNNGGDGLVVGHHLSKQGAQVGVYLLKARSDDEPNLKRLKDQGLLIANAEDDQRSRVLRNMLESADIIIDGVLGTGFKLPLKGGAKSLLGAAKKMLEKRSDKPYVIAVDCPSAIDCDTGEVAKETLFANLTVTLAAVKPGLLRFPGASYVGELVVGDIGIPQSQKQLSSIKLEMAEDVELSNWLPERSRDAHKGTFGRVLVIAGSVNYPGAAGLSGLAAYRVGAGLVTMAVPSVIQPLIAPGFPEATWLLLPHELGVISENALNLVAKEFEKTQAVLIGPGFGLEETTKGFLAGLFGADRAGGRKQIGFVQPGQDRVEPGWDIPPCVVDADGLKLLVEIENWNEILPEGSILTPHPGEMAIMTGEKKDAIQDDRVTSARKWAKMWGHIVVLKGAFTVVAAPNGRATVIPIASAALSKAGTGDVLAGAIAGYLAQGLNSYKAATLGSYVHGRAGEMVAEALGTTASVLAGEVAEAIPWVLSEI